MLKNIQTKIAYLKELNKIAKITISLIVILVYL